MTDQMILDKLNQVIRIGFVNARQPEKMRCKVTLPDTPGGALVTDWLPVLCPRACGDMQYDLPDIGDQVLCIFLPNGLERGFVVGSMYGGQTPPVQSGDKTHRTFSDGATIEYDRASHALKAEIPGTAEIKCAQSITLEAPIIYLRGTLTQTAKDGSPGISSFSGGMTIQNGGLNVTSGDVVASGVSLASHTNDGVQPGAGTSSYPSGGSSSSPGTAPQSVPEMGTAAYAAWSALNLLNLREKMDNSPNPPSYIDELVECLPAIAESMAAKCALERNRQGWLYLAEMFKRWLAGSANMDPAKGGEPFKVDWQWLNGFERVQLAVKDITGKLFTENSRNLLIKRLEREDKFKSGYCEFDFIHPAIKIVANEEIPAWRQWPDLYFQSAKIVRPLLPEIYDGASFADGAQTAMGAFMVYALAKGYTEPDHAGGHKIVVQEVALVAYDSFNFDGDEQYFYWSCPEKDFSMDPDKLLQGYRQLTNNDFRSFMAKYGHGDAFVVVSGPEPVAIGGEYVYNK